MTQELNDRDAELRRDRILLWDQKEGPRVGDFIGMNDGTVRRFTHDWDEMGLQVTSSLAPSGGSFYFANGYMDYSGGLDAIVPLAHIQEISGHKDGACWFFHHDHKAADNGVYTSVPCRIFKEVLA